MSDYILATGWESGTLKEHGPTSAHALVITSDAGPVHGGNRALCLDASLGPGIAYADMYAIGADGSRATSIDDVSPGYMIRAEFWFRIGIKGQGTVPIVEFFNVDNAYMGGFNLRQTLDIEVMNSYREVVSVIDSMQLIPGQWYSFQIRATYATWTYWILDIDNINLFNGNVFGSSRHLKKVRLGGGSSDLTWRFYYDDFRMHHTGDAGNWNETVLLALPTSDHVISDFSGHYTDTDDCPPNDDSDYAVCTDTGGAAIYYNEMQDGSAIGIDSSALIAAVLPLIFANKESGNCQAKYGMRYLGSYYLTTQETVQPGYPARGLLYEDNPDTSLPWEWYEIDLIKIGLDDKSTSGHELRCTSLMLMVLGVFHRDIEPTTIPSQASVETPGLKWPQDVTIASGIASQASVETPSVSKGLPPIYPEHIPSQASVMEPGVKYPQDVEPSAIASSASVFAPLVKQPTRLYPTTIASSAFVGVPTIMGESYPELKLEGEVTITNEVNADVEICLGISSDTTMTSGISADVGITEAITADVSITEAIEGDVELCQ